MLTGVELLYPAVDAAQIFDISLTIELDRQLPAMSEDVEDGLSLWLGIILLIVMIPGDGPGPNYGRSAEALN